MRRRSLLAALAAGLAGCGGSGDGSRDPFDVPSTTPPTETDAPATTTTDPDLPPGIEPTRDLTVPEDLRRAVTSRLGRPRRLAIAGGSLPTEQTGARLTAGFLDPPTPESPARVWIGLTNDAGGQGVFGFGPTPPFSNYWARPADGPGGSRAFLLVTDDDRRFPYGDLVPETPTDGRWVASDTLGTPTEPVGETWITLSPGESVAGTYRLLVHPDADPGERGSYRFGGAPWPGTELVLSDYLAGLPDPGESRFAPDQSVPPLPSTPGTRWYHEVAAAESPPGTFLRPEYERFPIGEGSIELRLENYEPYTVPVGPWRLYKRHGDGWRRIAPWDPDDVGVGIGGQPHAVIDPGGRAVAEFAPARSVRPEPRVGVAAARVGGLGGGTYAIVFGPASVGGPAASAPAVVDDEADPGVDEAGRVRVGLAALLELTGDAATVEPDRERTTVERDGPTVTVRVESRFSRTTAEGPELVVRPIPGGADPGDARDAGSLLPEQVNQFAALRNALPYVEDGVETVRVVADGYRVLEPLAAFGSPESPLTFGVRGDRYLAWAVDAVAASTEATTGSDGSTTTSSDDGSSTATGEGSATTATGDGSSTTPGDGSVDG